MRKRSIKIPRTGGLRSVAVFAELPGSRQRDRELSIQSKDGWVVLDTPAEARALGEWLVSVADEWSKDT